MIVLGVDRERAFFVGDNPAITVSVDRSAQGDAIDIQAQVQKTVDTLVETLPDNTKMELIRTAEHISVSFQCSFKMPSLGLRWSLVCSSVFERENCLLGGRGHSNSHLCRNCANVCGWHHNKYDFTLCPADYAWTMQDVTRDCRWVNMPTIARVRGLIPSPPQKRRQGAWLCLYLLQQQQPLSRFFGRSVAADLI